jgi:serine/threonine protein kinase
MVAGRMSHENVVPVYDYVEEGGVPYIAMKYHARGSLARVAQRLSPRRRSSLCRACWPR